MSRLQRTLKAPVSFAGVGVHTGQAGRVTVEPAPVGAGRVFLKNGVEIPARVENVVSCERATTLGQGGETLSTVEHLLAAASALGLDNLLIRVEGPEIPILDGSSAPYVEAFEPVEQDAPCPSLQLRRPVSVGSGASLALALPHPELKLEYVLDYAHPMLGTQEVHLERLEDFPTQFAPARTFALWEEVRVLLERGLAQGGDLANALVVKEDGFSSPLRLPLEPARHKCLDLLGDLALLGQPLQARVLVLRGGHRLHVELARAIRKEETAHDGRHGDQEEASSSLPLPVPRPSAGA